MIRKQLDESGDDYLINVELAFANGEFMFKQLELNTYNELIKAWQNHEKTGTSIFTLSDVEWFDTTDKKRKKYYRGETHVNLSQLTFIRIR